MDGADIRQRPIVMMTMKLLNNFFTIAIRASLADRYSPGLT